MNKLIFIILFLIGCGDTYSDKYSFNNEACKQAIQMGYPSEVCECIETQLSEINNPMDVTGELVNQLLENCVKDFLKFY